MVTGGNPSFQFQSAPKQSGARKWIIIGVIALLVVAAAVVAWLILNPIKEGEPTGACFLLIDRTSSVSSAASVEHYEAMAEQTILGCADKSVIMAIGSFDQNGTSIELATNAAADDGYDKEFKLYPGSGRSASKRQGQLDDNVEAALSAAADILEESADKTRGSDLISAIDQSAVVLNRLSDEYEGVGELFLVVLSDGIQISDSYTFADFTEGGDVGKYVEDAGVETDLTGVEVNFGGVASGTSVDGQSLAAWFESQVGDFWALYIETAGGRLCEYSADPVRLPVGC